MSHLYIQLIKNIVIIHICIFFQIRMTVSEIKFWRGHLDWTWSSFLWRCLCFSGRSFWVPCEYHTRDTLSTILAVQMWRKRGEKVEREWSGEKGEREGENKSGPYIQNTFKYLESPTGTAMGYPLGTQRFSVYLGPT